MLLIINKIILEADGKIDDYFDNISISSITKHKVVNLMNKTSHAEMTPRYQFTINRIEPVGGSPVDLENIANGSVTLQFVGGKRRTYTGVYTLETGDGTIDGETEYSHPISFSAEGMTEE